MPKCKNDSSKLYTGNEPSPKGLGFCAHSEKIGTIKKGKDENIWIVKKTKSGSKRWIKKQNIDKLDCSKFVFYEKKNKKQGFIEVDQIIGFEFKKGFINKLTDFNTFSKKSIKIPDGYKKLKLKQDYIKKNWCDSSKQRLTKNDVKIKHFNSKTYLTHNNYDRPFIVYISDNEVNIYMQPTEKFFISKKDYYKKWTYNKKIATYKNPLKIFIGKSPKTKITENGNGYGKQFDGNSILLQISKNNYISIGKNIYKFSTKDDQIKEYISPVGNNDIPYPVAIGYKNIYFILDLKYISIDKFPKLTKDIKNNAYLYYYGIEGKETLSKYAKSMLKIKKILN